MSKIIFLFLISITFTLSSYAEDKNNIVSNKSMQVSYDIPIKSDMIVYHETWVQHKDDDRHRAGTGRNPLLRLIKYPIIQNKICKVVKAFQC